MLDFVGREGHPNTPLEEGALSENCQGAHRPSRELGSSYPIPTISFFRQHGARWAPVLSSQHLLSESVPSGRVCHLCSHYTALSKTTLSFQFRSLQTYQNAVKNKLKQTKSRVLFPRFVNVTVFPLLAFSFSLNISLINFSESKLHTGDLKASQKPGHFLADEHTDTENQEVVLVLHLLWAPASTPW